ncbi:MAG: reprolysin-like metallopeptidase, partial [Vicingaceae bacterium]
MKKSTFSISRKITIAAACILIANAAFSQRLINPWSEIKESAIKENKTQRFILPSKYKVMKLNVGELKNQLKYTKLKSSGEKKSNTIIKLPNPEGGFSNYYVYRNTTMHPDLEAKFPEIRTYNAVNTTNPSELVKLDVTPRGFHAMVLSPDNGTFFIDPHTKGDTENYQVYYKNDYSANREMNCNFSEHTEFIKPTNSDKSFGSCELRTYRLALACTGEYAIAVGGGTVAGALAAQVTTMNRVNFVYERDIAVTFTIIGNNNQLIFTNPNTDPYTNNSGGQMLGQNQSTVNNIIGSSNYDIGHVFST